MRASSDSKPKNHIDSSSKMKKVSGTKWEYPIPKSREYWRKFCDDAERKLLRVRDPSSKLSYLSFIPDSSEISVSAINDDKLSNPNLCFDNNISTLKRSKNSVHKVSPSIFTFSNTAKVRGNKNSIKKSERKETPPSSNLNNKHNNVLFDDSKQFSKSRNANACNFRKLFSAGKKQKDLSLNWKDPLKVSEENLNRNTLVSPNSENAIMVSEDELIPNVADDLDILNKNEREIRRSIKNQNKSKYSIRTAYKALKFLTSNKKLNFKPEIFSPSEELHSESGGSSSGDLTERFESPEARDIGKVGEDDELYFRDVQEKLKRMYLENIAADASEFKKFTFEPRKSMSKSISTGSRSTSGPSKEFASCKPSQGPSSKMLSAIPKFGGFPRKHGDRCLSCMYKSFEAPRKERVSLPTATLRKLLTHHKKRISPSRDLSSDSDASSASLLAFKNVVEAIPNYKVKIKDVRFPELAESGEAISEEVISAASKVECENIPRKRDIVGSEVPSKTYISKDKREEDVVGVLSKCTEDIRGKATSVSGNFERSKMSSSIQSSDEEDSASVTLGDDPSKSKYLAPCHAPTVFRPSLEPLKALKHRKPTTLQARIALNEGGSSDKDISDDEYYDGMPDKSKLLESRKKKKTAELIADKSKLSADASSAAKTLIRSKSLAEKLICQDGESGKTESAVRRRSSLPSIETTPRALTTGASQISRIQSKETLGSAQDDLLLKQLSSTDSSKHVADLPLRTPEGIMGVLEGLIEKGASPVEMLSTLCTEFTKRVAKNRKNSDLDAKRCNKVAARLTKLLVDSKGYLHPDKFPSDLVFSTNQPPLTNPRQLRRILPLKSYNLIAPLLGMPEWYPKKIIGTDDIDDGSQHVTQASSDDGITFDLRVHPPTLKDIGSDGEETYKPRKKLNPYALFLKKPRRKAVTWRPLTEYDLKGYDPNATLNMRAKNIMTKISHDFCDWLKSLGGAEDIIDEEVLREMFEIDFNAEACKAMQISIREMSVVPKGVALARNCPGATKLALTKRYLVNDAKAEEKPPKTVAFGKSLPNRLKFIPPKNLVQKLWLDCENVPRDLETMDMVWKDITNLDSVRGFVKWLYENPQVSPPEALKTIASMDTSALKRDEEDETFAHLQLDLDQFVSLKVADYNNDVTI